MVSGNSYGKSSSPTCKVIIGNVSVSILVDPGADATLIDKRTLRTIPRKFIYKRSPANYKIRGVTGQSMATCGEVQIKSQIRKGSYIIKFVVVKNLGKSGILGSDFFSQ